VLQTEWTKQYIIILTNKLPLASPTNEHILTHLINDFSVSNCLPCINLIWASLCGLFKEKIYRPIYCRPIGWGAKFFPGGRPGPPGPPTGAGAAYTIQLRHNKLGLYSETLHLHKRNNVRSNRMTYKYIHTNTCSHFMLTPLQIQTILDPILLIVIAL